MFKNILKHISLEKRFLLFAVILFGTVLLYSNVNGEAGWQFLKVIGSPSSSAQAGTGVFSEDFDAFAFIINPASVPHYNRKILSAFYNKWITQTNISSVAYLTSNGKKAFGISARYLDYGKLDRTDETGDFIGEFHPMDIVATTNFSYRLTPVHYVGVNLSLLYEQIDTSSSYGVSADLGYLYLSPIEGLRFAGTIKNLGVTSKMDMERIKLPLSFDFSIIKDFKFSYFPVSTELKIIKNIDDSDIKINYGINASYKNLFTLRLGYKLNYESQNLSAGIGFKIEKIRVDYSFVPFSNELGDVHQIGINYIF